MIGFIMKIIICPAVAVLASYLISGLSYLSFYQSVMVGLVIAVVGQMMEVLLLNRRTIWLSTFLDLIAATVIVYFVSAYLGARVTFLGSLLVSGLIAVTEYFQHVWLVRTGKAR